MKKNGGHPNYRQVLFVDSSTGYEFVCGSTLLTDEKKKVDGVEYPVCRVSVSSASHPYFTGSRALVDAEGRVDKFKKRYPASQKTAAPAAPAAPAADAAHAPAKPAAPAAPAKPAAQAHAKPAAPSKPAAPAKPATPSKPAQAPAKGGKAPEAKGSKPAPAAGGKGQKGSK